MNKFEIEINEGYYIGFCKLTDKKLNIVQKNPHCTEFFCTHKNIYNISDCFDYLKKNKIFKSDNLKNKNNLKKNEYIKYFENNKNNNIKCSTINNGYIYDFYVDESVKKNNNEITNYKNIFYKKKFIYKYNDIPLLIKYDVTINPKTVVHWGQLKMFLVILLFLLNKVDVNDKIVYVIYPGSAHGDNILILSDMFPNVKWCLIDPGNFNKKLFKHPNVIEIINDFFTDETAKYYYDKFSKRNKDEKLLFTSDIRLNTRDEDIENDNSSNIRWHEIIKPDFSYLKLRLPYYKKEYDFYDGKIYVQAFAPVTSGETRILLKTDLIKKKYLIEEYESKMYYFNRIIRPSYYKKSIINENQYFDHCYDCTYFSYLIYSYLIKFKSFNPFKTNDVLEIMLLIKERLTETTIDKINYYNNMIKHNIVN